MSLRTKAVLAVTVVALAGGTALTTTPASASAASGYVSGQGSINDDWGDEGVLSTGSYNHNNAVALWQAVLWADGKLPYSGIDCRFGTATANATKAWQRAHSGAGTADGKVGHKTFGAADGRLSYQRTEGNYEVHKYHGAKHDLWIKRTSGGGAHYIRVKTSIGYKAASYRSASACG
jgi:hypothetical protein